MVARNEEYAGGEFEKKVEDAAATRNIVDGVTFVVLAGIVVGLAVLDAKAAEKLAKSQAARKRIEEENRRREIREREVRLKDQYDSASVEQQREIRNQYSTSLRSDNTAEREIAALRLKQIREQEAKEAEEKAEQIRLAKIEADKKAKIELEDKIKEEKKERDKIHDDALDAQIDSFF